MWDIWSAKKTCDPKKVTKKPHSAGEVQKESGKEGDLVQIFRFSTINISGLKLVIKLMPNLNISPTEFDHSEVKSRAEIQL